MPKPDPAAVRGAERAHCGPLWRRRVLDALTHGTCPSNLDQRDCSSTVGCHRRKAVPARHGADAAAPDGACPEARLQGHGHGGVSVRAP